MFFNKLKLNQGAFQAYLDHIDGQNMDTFGQGIIGYGISQKVRRKVRIDHGLHDVGVPHDAL